MMMMVVIIQKVIMNLFQVSRRIGTIRNLSDVKEDSGPARLGLSALVARNVVHCSGSANKNVTITSPLSLSVHMIIIIILSS